MSRPEDLHTPNVEAAADFERHHGIDLTPGPEHDEPFTSACVDPCGDYCWGCQTLRRWSA